MKNGNSIMRITNRSLEEGAPPPSDDMDWEALRALSDDEVERRALEDPDAQPMTSAELSRMRRLPDTKLLRERLGLTQQQFASRYMLSVATVRDWEQKRRVPVGPALGYLYSISAHPDIIASVVAEERAIYGAPVQPDSQKEDVL